MRVAPVVLQQSPERRAKGMWNTRFAVWSRAVMVMTAVTVGFTAPSPLWAKGMLENPHTGSFTSGIGIISGWVCHASRVDIIIDEVTTLEAAYGTDREDTV